MNNAKTITIVLADDHRIVRQGLHALLKAEADFDVIGEAGDGLKALDLVRSCLKTHKGCKRRSITRIIAI